ncbi:MAG TPA: kelch repeat-containing protein [Candidatus Sulfotelmatobacter sp.]|nr:kelch repeat-containing protein [Candidatus Sulfotelmatobacter sp.]
MKVCRKLGIALFALAWCSIAIAQEPFTAGTWTRTTNNPSSTVAHALLLSDGSVLVNSMYFQNHSDPWYRLVPDATGSYTNGKWINAGTLPSGYNPLYFASTMLPSGQVVIFGGEYNNGGSVWTTKGALFNPVTNTWTSLTAPSGWTTVGDAQSILLQSGHMMLANCCTTQQAILTLNGTTATWASTGTGKSDWNDEEGWTLLPNGNILTVDAYVSGGCCKMGYQLYNEATGTWTTASNTTVVNLVDPGSLELGPAPLLPNGTVFGSGATTNNAIYTVSTGTWAVAPSFGNSLDIADGPAAVLPNGNALFDTSPGIFNTGSKFFEWDGTTLNATSAPPNAGIDSSYVGGMVVLPTGQVLFTDFSSDVEIYTPASTAPCAGCAPTIKHVATTLTHGSKSNRIAGTLFDGMDQGGYYGDDNQADSNFPLVRITDSKNHVVYCRSHNWTPGLVATGSKIMTTLFDIPASIATGPASLVVVANGIPSAPVQVTIN